MNKEVSKEGEKGNKNNQISALSTKAKKCGNL